MNARARPDPLDDARALLRDMPPADAAAATRLEAALARFGPLGLLKDTALWLAAWPGEADRRSGRVLRPIFSLYVSAYATDADASERGRATLERLAAGGGAVSALAQAQGAGVDVFDLGIERPAPTPQDAADGVMSAREAAATLAFGMEAVAKAPDLLILTDATEGSATIAAEFVERLAEAGDPFDTLRRHAGREIAAVAGAILAARRQRTPVILDGAAPLAAAAVLAAYDPDALAHCRAAAASPAAEALKLLGLTTGLSDLAPGVAGAAALALARLSGEMAADALG